MEKTLPKHTQRDASTRSVNITSVTEVESTTAAGDIPAQMQSEMSILDSHGDFCLGRQIDNLGYGIGPFGDKKADNEREGKVTSNMLFEEFDGFKRSGVFPEHPCQIISTETMLDPDPFRISSFPSKFDRRSFAFCFLSCAERITREMDIFLSISKNRFPMQTAAT